MSTVDILLSRNLIPILKHSNPWFSFMQEEADRAVRGLLPGRSVGFFIIKSVKKNAYSFKVEDEYFITITDAAFKVIEKSITVLLNAETFRQFMRDWFQLDYDVNTSIPDDMTWGVKPYTGAYRAAFTSSSTAASAQENLWYALFHEIFENAMVFMLLHEVAHIEHGNADGLTLNRPKDIYHDTIRSLDFMNIGGRAKNRHVRFSEYEADAEAANWLFQRAVRRGMRDIDFGFAHLGLAEAGMLIAVLHFFQHAPDTEDMPQAFDHPSLNVRL